VASYNVKTKTWTGLAPGDPRGRSRSTPPSQKKQDQAPAKSGGSSTGGGGGGSSSDTSGISQEQIRKAKGYTEPTTSKAPQKGDIALGTKQVGGQTYTVYGSPGGGKTYLGGLSPFKQGVTPTGGGGGGNFSQPKPRVTPSDFIQAGNIVAEAAKAARETDKEKEKRDFLKRAFEPGLAAAKKDIDTAQEEINKVYKDYYLQGKSSRFEKFTGPGSEKFLRDYYEKDVQAQEKANQLLNKRADDLNKRADELTAENAKIDKLIASGAGQGRVAYAITAYNAKVKKYTKDVNQYERDAKNAATATSKLSMVGKKALRIVDESKLNQKIGQIKSVEKLTGPAPEIWTKTKQVVARSTPNARELVRDYSRAKLPTYKKNLSPKEQTIKELQERVARVETEVGPRGIKTLELKTTLGRAGSPGTKPSYTYKKPKLSDLISEQRTGPDRKAMEQAVLFPGKKRQTFDITKIKPSQYDIDVKKTGFGTKLLSKSKLKEKELRTFELQEFVIRSSPERVVQSASSGAVIGAGIGAGAGLLGSPLGVPIGTIVGGVSGAVGGGVGQVWSDLTYISLPRDVDLPTREIVSGGVGFVTGVAAGAGAGYFTSGAIQKLGTRAFSKVPKSLEFKKFRPVMAQTSDKKLNIIAFDAKARVAYRVPKLKTVTPSKFGWRGLSTELKLFREAPSIRSFTFRAENLFAYEKAKLAAKLNVYRGKTANFLFPPRDIQMRFNIEAIDAGKLPGGEIGLLRKEPKIIVGEWAEMFKQPKLTRFKGTYYVKRPFLPEKAVPTDTYQLTKGYAPFFKPEYSVTEQLRGTSRLGYKVIISNKSTQNLSPYWKPKYKLVPTEIGKKIPVSIERAKYPFVITGESAEAKVYGRALGSIKTATPGEWAPSVGELKIGAKLVVTPRGQGSRVFVSIPKGEIGFFKTIEKFYRTPKGVRLTGSPPKEWAKSYMKYQQKIYNPQGLAWKELSKYNLDDAITKSTPSLSGTTGSTKTLTTTATKTISRTIPPQTVSRGIFSTLSLAFTKEAASKTISTIPLLSSLSAVLKQKTKTRPKTATLTNTRLSEMQKTVPSIKTRQLEKTVTRTLEKTTPRTINKITTRQTQPTRTTERTLTQQIGKIRTAEKTNTLEKQVTRVIEKQAQRQLERTRTIEKTAVRDIPTPPIPEIIIPSLFGLGTPDQQASPYTGGGKGTEPGYHAYAKQNKKWLKVTKKPISQANALHAGAEAVDNTTAKTFEIRKTNQKITPERARYFPEYKFRQPKGKTKLKKGVYVEKNKYAIDTAGEFQGITVKGWLAAKRKREQRLTPRQTRAFNKKIPKNRKRLKIKTINI